jgi:hypothetical protein
MLMYKTRCNSLKSMNKYYPFFNVILFFRNGRIVGHCGKKLNGYSDTPDGPHLVGYTIADSCTCQLISSVRPGNKSNSTTFPRS